MKRFLVIGCVVLLGGLFASSCSKGGVAEDDNDNGGPHVVSPNDVTPPVIDITTPVADQVFTNGASISITGRISDDLGLYRGTIKVTNDANGEVLRNQAYEIHGLLQYNFTLSYTVATAATANYTVTVTFEDHGLNSISKSVKVKINP
jgi:hypothetical protein